MEILTQYNLYEVDDAVETWFGYADTMQDLAEDYADHLIQNIVHDFDQILDIKDIMADNRDTAEEKIFRLEEEIGWGLRIEVTKERIT